MFRRFAGCIANVLINDKKWDLRQYGNFSTCERKVESGVYLLTASSYFVLQKLAVSETLARLDVEFYANDSNAYLFAILNAGAQVIRYFVNCKLLHNIVSFADLFSRLFK